MPLPTRLVTSHFDQADGTPWALAPMTYRLTAWSYKAGAIIPGITIPTMTDEVGNNATPLWPTADGLKYAKYIATYPSGEQTKPFGIPAGDTSISLDELLALGGTYDYSLPELEDLLETYRAAIYAAFGNQSDPGLGDGLVGTRATGIGGLPTTVHDKLELIRLVTDRDTLEHAATAVDGYELIVNAFVTLQASLTLPATLGLRFEHGGRITVPLGMTLTIDGPLSAGRYQIFDGDGTVDGTPLVDYAAPEWFGAVGDGVADDTLPVQKAIDLYPRITGRASALYRITSARAQWTDTDIYSYGRVQSPLPKKYGGNRVIQLPNGVCYGVRIPDGGVVEDCRFLLTSGGFAAQKLHSAFITGDPHWGEVGNDDDATRVRSVKFQRNVIGVTPGSFPSPYKTTLAETVLAGGKLLIIAPDFTQWSRVHDGDQVRVTMDEGTGTDAIYFGVVASHDATARTITMVDGITSQASAGNAVKGPFVAPIASLISQSADALAFNENEFDGENLVGMYGFDCNGIQILNNQFDNAEKLAALDYCDGIEFNNNKAYNSVQLLDLNKRCSNVTINGNIYDRDTVLTDGDGIVEGNGATHVTAQGNIFKKGTRGFIWNNKGLVYRSWRLMMRQNFAATDAAWAENIANSYFAVWAHITAKGNRFEQIQRCAHYIGDSWKVFTTERTQFPETTCGVDIEIDDTAIDCAGYPFFNRFNGVVQVMEGKQLRIKMHIDNPSAIRSWTSAAVIPTVPPNPPLPAVGLRTIQVTARAGVDVATLAGQPIRLVQSATNGAPGQTPGDDSASIYIIKEATLAAGVWTITVQRNITVGTDAGQPVWIGPGNSCGDSFRSWIDSDQWSETRDILTTVSSPAAAGQPVVIIPDPNVPVASLAGKQIKIDHDDSVTRSYIISSAVDNGATYTVTVGVNLAAPAAAGRTVQIIGVSVTINATGATARSDCEVLESRGYVKNVASQGFFAYRPRIASLDGVTLENVGSRDRVNLRYAGLVVEPEVRAARVFGSINIDNSAELNQAGAAPIVDRGLGLTTSTGNLNDGVKWSTSRRFLRLWGSRITGHAIIDLELSDARKLQVITLTPPTTPIGTYSFTLSDGTHTSTPIAVSITSLGPPVVYTWPTLADVQTAIRSLGGEFAGATVLGDPPGPWTVYTGPLAPDLTANVTAFGGGSVAVTAGTPLAAGPFLFAQTDPTSNTIGSQRWTSGYRIPFALPVDFAANTANNQVQVVGGLTVTGARKGDLVEASYTAQKGSWVVDSNCHNDNTLEAIATNRSGVTGSLTGGILQGYVQKL